MARTTTPAATTPKEPGRLKQMYQVFQMTRRYDSNAIWWLILLIGAIPAMVKVLGLLKLAKR